MIIVLMTNIPFFSELSSKSSTAQQNSHNEDFDFTSQSTA